MDGNLASGNMVPGASYGVIDLQGSMHLHHHQNPNAPFHHHLQQASHCQRQSSMMHPPMHEVFPTQINHLKDCDQQLVHPMMDYDKKGECCKNSASDDDELSLNTDEGVFCQNETGKGKKGSPWQRMKWTDLMVRLLITAVSYLGEDTLSDCNSSGRRKATIVQKKGKWKLISKVLAERGFYVSPQQCEDKFNDLNKRYKRLTDILGRGTSCKVVENPALLDLMSHIPDKAKDDVRKILSSKHLFYEEMCSYHNGNRLNLPANPALQRSLQLAIMSKDDHDTKKAVHEDLDEDDQGDSEDGEEDAEDNRMFHRDSGGSCFHKRLKHGMDHEEMAFPNSLGSQDFNRRNDSISVSTETSHVLPEGPKASLVQMEMLMSRSIQLEEQSLLIQSQILELEQQRLKWQRFSKKKDKELDKMRLENERIKLENERLTLDLKQKQLERGVN
ncbi:hypothetical protein KFK09_024606 [Dendrobium nobile]|uniref:Myb/SANT-like DNA-binding domain-containing protein n=1 Tax=Dendrobium nobile TaxID=94219 RepID=A0A8T3AEA0_DENNO|nr:hypothetical protein KFK09_024606 [Dendrobium nobile]